MAVFYRDTTTKYDLGRDAIQNTSRTFGQELSGIYNSIFGGISSIFRSILPFGELSESKNQRLRDEYAAGNEADREQIEADKSTGIMILIIIVIIVIAVVLIKKT